MLYGLGEAEVEGTTAADGTRLFQLDLLDEGGCLVGQGLIDPGGDIFLADAFGHPGNCLRFAEDGASSAERDRVSGLEGERAEVP